MAAKHRIDDVECSDVDVPHVEYAVYTVSKVDSTNDNQAHWAKKHTTLSRRKALARAKILHRSHDYSRVEIKKMVCNDHDVCSVQGHYKIFEHKSARYLMWRSIAFFIGFLAAVTCVALVAL